MLAQVSQCLIIDNHTVFSCVFEYCNHMFETFPCLYLIKLPCWVNLFRQCSCVTSSTSDHYSVFICWSEWRGLVVVQFLSLLRMQHLRPLSVSGLLSGSLSLPVWEYVEFLYSCDISCRVIRTTLFRNFVCKPCETYHITCE